MPQPLSRVLRDAPVRIGNAGDRLFDRHPRFAVLAAETIASWSNVESFMLRLFVQLMGGVADTAATVFLALEIQSAKTAAIRAVAQSLPHEQQQLLGAILAIAKTQQKARDKLAHWVWGECPALPDVILLVNPKNTVGGDLDRDQIFVYREDDFHDAIAANDRLCGFALHFRWILDGRQPGARDGQLFAQLSAEPEIREKLDRPA